jgi:hypothetical protein
VHVAAFVCVCVWQGSSARLPHSPISRACTQRAPVCVQPCHGACLRRHQRYPLLCLPGAGADTCIARDLSGCSSLCYCAHCREGHAVVRVGCGRAMCRRLLRVQLVACARHLAFNVLTWLAQASSCNTSCTRMLLTHMHAVLRSVNRPPPLPARPPPAAASQRARLPRPPPRAGAPTASTWRPAAAAAAPAAQRSAHSERTVVARPRRSRPRADRGDGGTQAR